MKHHKIHQLTLSLDEVKHALRKTYGFNYTIKEFVCVTNTGHEFNETHEIKLVSYPEEHKDAEPDVSG